MKEEKEDGRMGEGRIGGRNNSDGAGTINNRECVCPVVWVGSVDRRNDVRWMQGVCDRVYLPL